MLSIASYIIVQIENLFDIMSQFQNDQRRLVRKRQKLKFRQ